MQAYLRSVFLCLPLLGLNPEKSHAQQAIINLPSADLTPQGQTFIMNESFIRPYEPDAEWKTTNFFTYGLTPHTELAVTTFNAGLPKTTNFTTAFGFKSVYPLFAQSAPKTEWKLTTGYMLPVSFQGNGVGSYGYTHLSARLPKLKTRLTTGIKQVHARSLIAM